MGSILKFSYKGKEKQTVDSHADECSVDEDAGDKDLITAREPSLNFYIPTKPRTHRVLVGILTYVPEEDAEHFVSTENLRESTRSRDDDFGEGTSKTKRRCDDDFGEGTSKTKRRKKVEKRAVTFRRKQPLQDPPSELTQNLQDHIRTMNSEAAPLFVAQKALYVTDIRRGQSRLSLPESLINPDFFDKFMTDDEKTMLNRKEHVQVSLVDNQLHEYNHLNLAKWNSNSSSIYVLTTGWNDVVKDNTLEEVVLQTNGKEEAVVVMKEDEKLKSDVVVQVWCFRKEARLWFALVIRGMTECNVIGQKKDGRNIVTKLQLD